MTRAQQAIGVICSGGHEACPYEGRYNKKHQIVGAGFLPARNIC